jgi:hypothetical protein
MRLSDVRRLAIQDHVRVHFAIAASGDAGALKCVVDEHGVARVPGLAGVPGFNLEEAVAAAEEFMVEPVPLASAGKKAANARAERFSRAAFEAYCQRKAQPAHAGAAHDHDE